VIAHAGHCAWRCGPNLARSFELTVTNVTVITNRRTYSFELREGHINGATGRFYEVRFSYPEDNPRRTVNTMAKGFEPPKNYAYLVAGVGDFEPTIADAILDRIIHNAHRIELKGDSMRRKEKPTTLTNTQNAEIMAT